VGDADHGAPRFASAFFVGLHYLRHSSLVHANRSSPARSISMANAKFNVSDDRFTRGLIRRKTKQLIGRAGFSRQDGDDLEQDLLVRVLQSLPKFDPDQAHRNKFITTVVERHAANILRDKQAEKRDHRRISSLNVMIKITCEGPIELGQTIGDREQDARIGRHRRTKEDLAQLALDLAEVIATLPESWQTLLNLRKTRSMQEVADEMGVPRTTLNDWIRRIRQRFEATGMRDYLES
jgi:RNA polymerase sigma-70 factor (ECF subfamily)